jgi:hypothetical protein
VLATVRGADYALDMSHRYVSRRLKIGEKYFSEREVLEGGVVLVVLAEPGAGKSELLREFGRILDVVPVRASQFRHRTKASTNAALIIDALDEAAKIDQSSIDQIIVKAQEECIGCVVFASRSYEWEDARTGWVKDCFGVDPIIIRIEPFTTEEQKVLFAQRFPGEMFSDFAAEVDRFELTPLLGNPQFLGLFADAYVQSGRRFISKVQIFQDAVHRLALENGNNLGGKRRPSITEIFSMVSEVMAKLLLAGAAGVSTRERLENIDYPYLQSLIEGESEGGFTILDTQLFKPGSAPDEHEPVHRIVAEYCAARYLVDRVGDPRNPLSMRRLLAVIAPNGIVRDELRGLLGWMASTGPERLQRAAIELDPYAVIANGDPSGLLKASKKLLFEKLASTAEANPGFRRGDYWRRFSVGGFFTDDIASDAQRLLEKAPAASSLTDLILDLLANSGGPVSLAAAVRVILFDQNAARHTRTRALHALMKLGGGPTSADLRRLTADATPDAVMIAAELASEVGSASFDDDDLEALFRAYAGILTIRQTLRSDSAHMASYYLTEIVGRLTPYQTGDHLDRLTLGLTCTCGHEKYDCHCREGLSKVAGRLLDHFFQCFIGPHEPSRIWEWLKHLRYQYGIKSENSTAVKALMEDGQLRHELHRCAFAGLFSPEDVANRHFLLMMGHSHAGLSFHEDDVSKILTDAFDNDNLCLWAVFWKPPSMRRDARGPDALRRLFREHAIAKPIFAAEWSKRERGYRSWRKNDQAGTRRYERRWRRRETRDDDAYREDLAANLDLVVCGRHWGWIQRFSQYYFYDRKGIAKFTDDITVAENALRNCLPFLRPHMPTLSQLARNEGTAVAHAAFASCWIQFKDTGSLHQIERPVLMAVRTQSGKYQIMSDEEYAAFEGELDGLLFSGIAEAEAFAREYIEPSLAGPRNSHARVPWLGSVPSLKPLRGTLSLEWLSTHPDMPVSAREDLFDLAVGAGERARLLDLIDSRLDALRVPKSSDGDELRRIWNEDRQFWLLRKFFFAHSESDGWDEIKDDKDLIFILDEHAGVFRREEKWSALTAEKIYKILDTFVAAWKPVHLPNSYGNTDPPEERAWRFLTHIAWRIGNDQAERALPVINRLIEDPRFSEFKEALLTQRAEAEKKLALAGFFAPPAREIVALLDSRGIASVEDLRALVVEELDHLQLRLRTGETNPLEAYYDNSSHVDENTARNRVVDSLSQRMTSMNLPIVIEHHMADTNRCDFTVSAMIDGRRRLLVVEAKGQWHSQLFTAAEAQLDRRYASHQDAERQGIYLVFWFGPSTPVANRVKHGIVTANELQERITSAMTLELRQRINVVVLDLSKDV